MALPSTDEGVGGCFAQGDQLTGAQTKENRRR
jgi:hypothetical protein